jgi:hypothetical protein
MKDTPITKVLALSASSAWHPQLPSGSPHGLGGSSSSKLRLHRNQAQSVHFGSKQYRSPIHHYTLTFPNWLPRGAWLRHIKSLKTNDLNKISG